MRKDYGARHSAHVSDEKFHTTNDEKQGGSSFYFLHESKCFRRVTVCLLKVVHSV